MNTTVLTSETTSDQAPFNEMEFRNRMCYDPDAEHAIPWLQSGSASEPRTIGEFKSTKDSIEYVREILDRGAVSVRVPAFPDSPLGLCRHIAAIELPSDPEAKEDLLEWLEDQGAPFDEAPLLVEDESHALQYVIPSDCTWDAEVCFEDGTGQLLNRIRKLESNLSELKTALRKLRARLSPVT